MNSVGRDILIGIMNKLPKIKWPEELSSIYCVVGYMDDEVRGMTESEMRSGKLEHTEIISVMKYEVIAPYLFPFMSEERKVIIIASILGGK